MKIAFRIASLLVLVVLSTYYMSCKKEDDPEPSETDQLIAKFTGTWGVESNADVTFEDAAQDLNYENFAIAITGTEGSTSMNYQVSGRPVGPSPWNSSGTLAFGTPAASQLVREDGIVINYSFVDDNTLSLSFNFNKEQAYTSTGRSASVGGDWVFVLKKQQ